MLKRVSKWLADLRYKIFESHTLALHHLCLVIAPPIRKRQPVAQVLKDDHL